RRLAFSGNLTTHDAVIRREVALVEGGVFNTEALKYSVKRLNQLGYFKPIENQNGIKVEKTPGSDDRVDVTLKVEEQNRNAVNFGEVREGSTWSVGRPLKRFMRGYLNYTYELIDVDISDELLASTGSAATTTSSGAVAGTPLFNPYLDKGRHIDSRIAPSVVY